MSAGELRERVAFERETETPDGYGGQVTAWTEIFACAARVRPKLGGEEVTAARLQGRKVFTIKVRSFAQSRQVTTDWRARDARTGEIYNIRSIANPDERNEYLEMLAEAGVAT